MKATYDYYCPICRADLILLVDKDKKDQQSCEECGELLDRVYRGFPGTTRASYLDGQNKKTKDLKEAARLRSQAYSAPANSEERHGLLKEAAKKEKL